MRDLDSFCQSDGGRRSVRTVECHTALSPSKLPGLDLTLNPYRGCAHDCSYCYAPFLMRVQREEWRDAKAKADLPRLLRKEAEGKRGVIGLSTATDPYQPMELELGLTRRCLQELVRARAKVSVLTKSDLVTRDIDLLRALPQAEIGITITTMDDRLAKVFEPGAPSPSRRLSALKELSDAGLDTYVLIGPIIPLVTERGLEEFIRSIAATGCARAMTDRLRLRQGMLDRIMSRPGARDLGADFERLCSDEGHMHEIEGRIVDLCARHGIKVRSAF